MSLFESIVKLDQDLFFFINEKHSPFWDVAMSLYTRTEVWILFFLAIIWVIIKKYRFKAVLILGLLALTILFADQFSVFIKETVERYRPSHNPEIANLVHTVKNKGGLYGFFSSHAANTFAVAMFTSLLFRNYRFTVVVFFWAIFMCFTRIYLGLHYPGDILTGMVVGGAIGYAFYMLLSFLENRYFLLQAPHLGESKLKVKESKRLEMIFLFVLVMVLLIVSRLQHIHFL